MTTIERDSLSKSNVIASHTVTALSIVAGIITLFSLYLVGLLRWQGPFKDLWEFIPAIEQQFNGHWSMAYLLEAYGGAHRIFFPKLLFFIDWFLLGGQNNLTIVVAISCQWLYLALLIRTASTDTALSQQDRLLIFAAFMLSLFSTTQVNNFLYAMDVQWFMSNVLSLAAFTVLIKQPQKTACFLILGISAALCNFTGLMSLVAGTCWLCIQKPFKKQSIALILFTLGFSFFYIHNPKTSEHIVLTTLQHSESFFAAITTIAVTLFTMTVYLLRYLASPLSRDWPWVGAILSTSMIMTIFIYWRRSYSQSLSQWQNLCLLVASYIVLSGLATAFGRTIYPNSAIAERYQTLVLPLLPAVIGLVLVDLKSRVRILWLYPLLALLISFFLLPAQFKSAQEMAILSNRVQLAHTAARAGALDIPYVGATLSHPLLMNNINMVKSSDPFLRSRQLGYFHPFPQWVVGTESSTGDTGTLPACSGSIHPVLDSELGVWTFQSMLTHAFSTITDIALLQQRQLIGFGVPIRPEGSLLPLGIIPTDNRVFRAFAVSTRIVPHQPLTVLGFTADRLVCAQTFNLP